MKYSFEELAGKLPVALIEQLKKTPQNPHYHSEGNVFNHIKMVYEELHIYENLDLYISALFHDLGKIDTLHVYEKEKGIKVQTIGHEDYSQSYIDKYKDCYIDYDIDWTKVAFICLLHMRAHKYLAGEIKKEGKKAIFETHKYSKELLQFANADNKGRIKDMKNQSFLIITLGIPGAGKSYWRKDFTSKHPEFRVICPDDIRREVTGSVSNITQDALVWETAYHTLKELLANREDIIFDSTAVNTRTQKAIENIGKANNAIIIYKIFEVPLEVAKERIIKDIENNVDRSKVPMEIVEKMFNNFTSAKERVLVEVEAKNVFLLEEKFKDA